MANDAGLLAALGVVSACVAGLLWIIKFMFNRLVPLLENSNKLMAESNNLTKANTKITHNADQYLRQRNGRDIEFHAKQLESINAIPIKMQEIADAQAKTLIENFKKLPSQNIVNNVVVVGVSNSIRCVPPVPCYAVS